MPVGQIWTLTSVFSNDQLNYRTNPVTTAAWEIRSGVSAGNGGTVVASASSATATQTALSQTPGYFYAANPVQITASVSSLVLTAGTYWLTVYPTEGDRRHGGRVVRHVNRRPELDRRAPGQ